MQTSNAHSEEEYELSYLNSIMGTVAVNGKIFLDPNKKGAGRIKPTFWADAPWRIIPKFDYIPITLIFRDSQGIVIEKIKIEEAPIGTKENSNLWKSIIEIPKNNSNEFFIGKRYFVVEDITNENINGIPIIPLSKLHYANRGNSFLLRVSVEADLEYPRRYLKIHLANNNFPYSDNPSWFYGDTHYHSSYTNDFKEFGNPVFHTALASRCIGIDWLVITDHSVDLQDKNPYLMETGPVINRWKKFRGEVKDVNLNFKDDFVIIPGEEVSVIGSSTEGSDILHLLVFGDNFKNFIPGAFGKKKIFQNILSKINPTFKKLIFYLYGKIYGLGEVISGYDKAGKQVKELKDRSVNNQKLLAFAAHPTHWAQAPGGNWEDEDIFQLYETTGANCGVEAWNTDLKFASSFEVNPFDKWQRDTKYEHKNKEGINQWDKFLKKIVDKPSPRFSLIAGSDAHGSFNFSEGWWPDAQEFDFLRADDNSLGRMRTLVNIPGFSRNRKRKIPTIDQIQQSIKESRCIITNGPIVNFWIKHNQKKAGIGDVFELKDNGSPILIASVFPKDSSEYGKIESITIKYFFKNHKDTYEGQELLTLNGKKSIRLFQKDIMFNYGYIRLSLESKKTIPGGFDNYYCYTNPIWFRDSADKERNFIMKIEK